MKLSITRLLTYERKINGSKSLMCGLTGYLSLYSTPDTILETMANTIAHRGPNSSGIWCTPDQRIGLAHRRLAIVDLSSTGYQPMHSPSARYVLVFNGEIYNHQKLRAELEQSGNAPQWRGHSDTETLLVGIETWGIEATLQRSIGMFAIALWDKHTQTLTLARDRLGEKPLYYGWQGSTFLFGSELKALKTHPAFKAEINRNVLSLYMRHSYIPAPYSIYQDIHKLPPGSILTISLQQRTPTITPYWLSTNVATQGKQSPFSGTANDAIKALDTLLKDAIQQQMMADVPLGAFLSGGIDSSTVVALMQTQSSRPIKTFSIGFHEALYNEAAHAKAVAKHLGTDHTEWYITPDDCMAVIPRLSTLYDEPFADSSQVPTFLVSQLAKQHVTISLSGDAGDELFAGYNRYNLTQKIWHKLSKIPLPLRQMLANGITLASPNAWNRLTSPLQSLLPKHLQQANLGDKLHKAAGVMTVDSISQLYHGMVSQWHDPSIVVIGGTEPITPITDTTLDFSVFNDIERMMLLDLITYLPGDILCKVDRAAMGVSLETRVPFLDHRIVEFAWQLPIEYKLREGQTKWPLRQVLYQYVPKELIERPKMGFGIPIDSWLRSTLRDWAEDLLSESRLQQDGYFNPASIRQKWQEHLSGQRNWQHQLWNVLIFNQWLDHNR